MKKHISTSKTRHSVSLLLLGLLTLNVIPTTAQAEESSPESACFEILTQEAKNNSQFARLDLSQVKKVNTRRGRDISSKPFAVNTYEKFKEIFNTPIPKSSGHLPKFPHRIDEIPRLYRHTPQIHKSNRPNIMVVIANGPKTDIGNVDNDPATEYINGYFLDTRYVTFGRATDFTFSFPSLDPNAHESEDFPYGAPYQDMREYLLFTHHLSPEKGGDFVNCGLVSLTPLGDYKLKAQTPNEKSIRWQYYGGDRVLGTDFKNRDIHSYNNDDDESNHNNRGNFRVSDVRFTIAAKEIGEDQIPNYDNDLARVNAINVTYDNGNSYYNGYPLAKIAEQVMTDPKNQDLTYLELRALFYQAITETLDLGIMGEGSDLAFESQLLASTLEQPNTNSQSHSGPIIMEKFPYETFREVQKIKDEATRDWLIAAGAAGHIESSLGLRNRTDLNTFEKNALENPLTLEQKIENIQYVVDQAEDVADINLNDIEYKDVVFGEAVIPASDKRVKEIAKSAYLQPEIDALMTQKEQEIQTLKNAQNPTDSSLPDQQKNFGQIQKIEDRYFGKLNTLMSFENEYKTLKIEALAIKNKHKSKRINQTQYESQAQKVLKDFQSLVQKTKVKGQSLITPTRIDELSGGLFGNISKKNITELTAEPPQASHDLTKYMNWGFALFLVVLAFALACLGLVSLKKSKK